MLIDDDGSVSLVSVDEARRQHWVMFDAWRDSLAALGLDPLDVNRRSGRWKQAVEDARRAARLGGSEVPGALIGGVKHPDQAPQQPYQICRIHFDMGFPEDDRDDAPAERLGAINRESYRGTVLGENQTKNRALRAIIVDELQAPDEEHPSHLARIGWSFKAPLGIERPVVLELPSDLKGRQGRIETLLGNVIGGGVEIVPDLSAAAGAGARRGP